MLCQIPMWQQLNELSGDTLPSDEECLSMILNTSPGFYAQHNQLVSCVTCLPLEGLDLRLIQVLRVRSCFQS